MAAWALKVFVEGRWKHLGEFESLNAAEEYAKLRFPQQAFKRLEAADGGFRLQGTPQAPEAGSIECGVWNQARHR
ncbi:MAG TPA: hypothetical protein VNT60_03955 [Deinococcales bacterium]|nr:hypothetical protein [Deinococcales bacterium]